uniref:Uncharacterized protein n=1 Tax=Arundo donax TaxID=35708 RepID=A0A0A8YBK9_ARUDO
MRLKFALLYGFFLGNPVQLLIPENTEKLLVSSIVCIVTFQWKIILSFVFARTIHDHES